MLGGLAILHAGASLGAGWILTPPAGDLTNAAWSGGTSGVNSFSAGYSLALGYLLLLDMSWRRRLVDGGLAVACFCAAKLEPFLVIFLTVSVSWSCFLAGKPIVLHVGLAGFKVPCGVSP